MLNLYVSLLQLRRDREALRIGDFRSVDTAEGVFAYTRTFATDRLLVALNFTDEERVVRTGPGEILISTGPDRDGAINQRLILRPNEGIILALDDLSAME